MNTGCLDARPLDFKTSRQLQAFVDDCETSMGVTVTELVIHVSQERWLKFERFEKGFAIKKSDHIFNWRGRKVFIDTDGQGNVCNNCKTMHQ